MNTDSDRARLIEACRTGDIATLNKLIDLFDRAECEMLFLEAVEHGQLDVVVYLDNSISDLLCNPNNPDFIYTAMYCAAKHNHMKIVKRIGKSWRRDNESMYVSECEGILCCAAKNGNADMVTYFMNKLRFKISFDAAETAVELAVRTKNCAIVNCIVNYTDSIVNRYMMRHNALKYIYREMIRARQNAETERD